MRFLLATALLLLCAASAQAHNYQNRVKAQLGGQWEVPPVNTASSGSFSAHYYTSDYGYLKWKLNLYNVKDVIKAHIHLGGVGQEGDVAVVLFDTSKSPFSSKNVWFTGKIYAADLTGPLAGKHVSDLLDYIKNGQAYVNVHTQAWPEGAIRGQLEYY